MLFKNDIFHQNNLKLALWQVTNADIRLVLTFDITNVITNSTVNRVDRSLLKFYTIALSAAESKHLLVFT